jgi:hypothetical protein
MDKRIHLLETFPMRGDDGKRYVVHGYEHLAHLDGTPDLAEYWHPTGQAEYRLSSGEHVAVDRDGSMAVAPTGVRLSSEQRDGAAPARSQRSGRAARPRGTGRTH